MIILRSGIKKIEVSDNATVANHNRNDDLLDANLQIYNEHVGDTSGVHGSTSAATASTLMERDSAGRAKVADPAVASDIDTMGARDVAINAAINGKAPLSSPSFSGIPSAPTASAGTSTTQLATTAFVTAAVALARTYAP
ncbi:hypothetical protein [Cohnella lupini]|uniref:hypothetical protein n=1 Tax=Cohnella lupini TaxID=1294267 RepID=UPI001C6EDAE2|nr:hypothetical protein [Cohnella lupini]